MKNVLKWPTLIELFSNEEKQNRIIRFLSTIKSHNLCPERNLIFEAFEDITPDKVKVVWVNSTMLPSNLTARGRALAIKEDSQLMNYTRTVAVVDAISRYKNDITLGVSTPGSTPFDYSFQHWVDQGVMLMNCQLTAECFKWEGKIDLFKENSHSNLWRELLMEDLFKWFSNFEKPLIFVLFGEKAVYYKEFLNNFYHTVYTVAEPNVVSTYKFDYTSEMKDLFKDINHRLSTYSHSIDF